LFLFLPFPLDLRSITLSIPVHVQVASQRERRSPDLRQLFFRACPVLWVLRTMFVGRHSWQVARLRCIPVLQRNQAMIVLYPFLDVWNSSGPFSSPRAQVQVILILLRRQVDHQLGLQQGMRSETMSYTTPSYTTSSYTTTPSALITQMGYTTLNTDTKTITGSEDTFTRNTITPMSTLRNLKVHRDHLSLRFEMLLLCGRNEPQRLSAQVGVRCLFSPCNCIN
jgi:hypothetical protein